MPWNPVPAVDPGNPVETFINPLGPGHYLIIGNRRIKQLGGECSLIVQFIIQPIFLPILDRIGQEKHLPAGRSCHRAHRTVFEKGILEHPFPHLTVIKGGFTRSAGPYLSDITIYTRQ